MDYNATTIRQVNAATPLPFTLSLGEKTFNCEQLLRILPDRRLVFLASHTGNKVVIKIFFSEKHYKRELEGLKQLAEHSIPCPALLAHFEDPEHKTYIIIIGHIDNAVTLAEYWQQNNATDQCKNILAIVMSLLGKMHSRGLWQKDIHWNNFLLDKNCQPYIIDCGEIGIAAAPLSKKEALENLALFIAQMAPSQYELAMSQLNAYSTNHLANLSNLKKQAFLQQRKRLKRYATKTLRTATEFLAKKKWRSFIVVKKAACTPALRDILEKPDHYIAEGTALKRGNTATVAKINTGTETLVIKRYNIKNGFHAINRCWRPSRAIMSWQNAHQLLLIGIQTPEPLAIKECRLGPFRGKAYFIAKNIEGQSLKSFVSALEGQPVPSWLTEQLTAILANMWLAGISHGDLKANNFLVADNKLWIIDLDSMKVHPFKWTLKKAIKKDLARFFENWNDDIKQQFTSLEILAKRIIHDA